MPDYNYSIFICIMLHYKAFSLTWLAAFMNTTLFKFNSLLYLHFKLAVHVCTLIFYLQAILETLQIHDFPLIKNA